MRSVSDFTRRRRRDVSPPTPSPRRRRRDPTRRSGSAEVYAHEIPGGQYTNLLYQSKQLGLDERWAEIKKKYAQANLLLGDIPKVTPSSKVVGDLAQFMVSSNLEPEDVMASADSLPLPASVVSYFQGAIGVPPGGFPEPLTSKVRKGRSLPDGSAAYEGRPGATMPDYDFAEAKKELVEKYGEFAIDETEVLSHAMYPQVTEFPLPRTDAGGRTPRHALHTLALSPMPQI